MRGWVERKMVGKRGGNQDARPNNQSGIKNKKRSKKECEKRRF